MPTKLEKTVKREIEIDGQPFTVAISPEGLKITQKGFRKGQEVSWKELWTTGSDDESASSGGESTGMGGGSANSGSPQSTSMPGTSTGAFGGGSESGFR